MPHQVAWEDLALGNDQVCVFHNSCQLADEELDRGKNEGRETDRSSEGNLGRLTHKALAMGMVLGVGTLELFRQ